jgi:hypothetical protein
MELPNIVHPKIFKINGLRYQVVAYHVLTEQQARNAVLFFVATHKVKKSKNAKDKIFQIQFLGEFPGALL